MALVITLVLMSLAALVPAVASRLHAQPVATPTPAPSHTPPAAVLLPDERDRALQGVVILVNDHTFGTAFLIDAQGDLLTASTIVANSQSLRLIDNTAGMHQVQVLGIDSSLGIALIRSSLVDGVPMSFATSSPLTTGEPVMLLASPKLLYLQSAVPATITSATGSRLGLQVSDLPGNLGGPIVGSGGKVLAILTATGTAVAIDQARGDIAEWSKQTGPLLPLAPLPPNLVLRSSDTTSSPPATSPASTPAARVSLQSASPSRGSASRDTALTIQGSGFNDGPALHVSFIPVSSSVGAFDGLGAALASSSTLTVKVPAGEMVQDYRIQLTNGDGAVVNSPIGFTVVP